MFSPLWNLKEGPLLCSQDPTTAPHHESNEYRPYRYTQSLCSNKFTLHSWHANNGEKERKKERKEKKRKDTDRTQVQTNEIKISKSWKLLEFQALQHLGGLLCGITHSKDWQSKQNLMHSSSQQMAGCLPLSLFSCARKCYWILLPSRWCPSTSEDRHIAICWNMTFLSNTDSIQYPKKMTYLQTFWMTK